jgi:hypothetical protein
VWAEIDLVKRTWTIPVERLKRPVNRKSPGSPPGARRKGWRTRSPLLDDLHRGEATADRLSREGEGLRRLGSVVPGLTMPPPQREK